MGRQPWRRLLHPVFEFDIPVTLDGIPESQAHHAAIGLYESFAELAKCPDLFAEMMTGPPNNFFDFWQESRDANDNGTHTIQLPRCT